MANTQDALFTFPLERSNKQDNYHQSVNHIDIRHCIAPGKHSFWMITCNPIKPMANRKVHHFRDVFCCQNFSFVVPRRQPTFLPQIPIMKLQNHPWVNYPHTKRLPPKKFIGHDNKICACNVPQLVSDLSKPFSITLFHRRLLYDTGNALVSPTTSILLFDENEQFLCTA